MISKINILKKLIKKLIINNQWNIALSINGKEYITHKNPKRFWFADPFIIKDYNKKLYIFCEGMDLYRGYGVICAGEIIDNRISNLSIVLDDKIHMSYPCVFYYNNTYYMIPETSERSTIELWKSIEFPKLWIKEKILLDKVFAVDTTVFEYNNQMFLLSYIKRNEKFRIEVYKLIWPDLKIENIANSSFDFNNDMRPAGNIKIVDNVLIRPTQYGKRTYGEYIIFKKFDFNNINYSENVIGYLKTQNIVKLPKKYKKVHTNNKLDDISVIDVYSNKIKLNNILYILLRRYNKRYKKENKSILILCKYNSIYAGNFINSIYDLVGLLKKNGYTIVLAFPRNASERIWINKLKRLNIYIEFINDETKLNAIIEIRKIIKSYKCNIVHTHFSYYDIPCILSCFDKRNVKIISHFHSDFSMNKKNIYSKIKEIIRNNILGRRMEIIKVSKYIETYRIFKRKEYFIENGLASNFINNIKNDKYNIELKWKNCNKQKLIKILIFAWVPAIKGLDIAIEAIRTLIDKQYNIELNVVFGKKGKDDIVKYIRQTTNCSGNEKWIKYLPPNNNVFCYHYENDIMLSCSRSEGFSYSLLEALALGNSCVISNINATKWACKYEIVESFMSENSKDCANAIIKSINKLQDKYIFDIKNKISDTVIKYYSNEKWCNKIIKIYENKI